MKSRFTSIILIITLLFTGLAWFTIPVHAIGGSISLGGPGIADEGSVFSVGFSINANSNFSFNGTIVVENGTIVGSSIAPGETNGANIVVAGVRTSVANGSVSIRANGTAPVRVSITGSISSLDDFSTTSVPSPGFPCNGCTVSIRSAAEKAAADAAAAKAAQEAAQRQAAANAAAAEEAARQASINESIQAEEAAKAAEEASIAAAESEKASIEESIKEESMSIEASIAYESRMASLEESREARYKEISLAAIEATRAYAIDEMYFVPYGSKSMFAQHFLFAVANTIDPVPEGFTRVPLTVNDQEVDAFRSDDMAEGVYLVYGKKSEKSEPDFYYFQLDDDSLISYRDVNGVEAGEIPKVYADLVHLQEQEVETGNGSKVSYGPAVYIFYLVLSLIIFALAGVIIYLLKKQKKNEEEAAAAASVPETEPESTAVKEPDPVLPKTGENKSGPKNPQKKKASGPKRKNRTHSKK